MSATTDQLTTAVNNIESVLASLGAAFASYEAARASAKSARASGSGLARAEDIDHSFGSAQLRR